MQTPPPIEAGDAPRAGASADADRTLDGWLAAARADLSTHVPPPDVRERLMATVRLRQRAAVGDMASRRPVRARVRDRVEAWRAGAGRHGLAPAWVAAGAVATAVGLVAWTAWPAGMRDRVVSADGPFFALRPVASIAAEPRRLVVTTHVPRAWLADYGLPVDPARIDVPARAELMLSPRGTVLAVRVLE